MLIAIIIKSRSYFHTSLPLQRRQKFFFYLCKKKSPPNEREMSIKSHHRCWSNCNRRHFHVAAAVIIIKISFASLAYFERRLLTSSSIFETILLWFSDFSLALCRLILVSSSSLAMPCNENVMALSNDF